MSREPFSLVNNPWEKKIHYFESIDSTNTRALLMGEGGAPEGTILIASEQKQGRGQFQRSWSSPAGKGLWMSLLLRPTITPEIIPSLSRFAVVALYDAIIQSGIEVSEMKIKPPNDLLISGKKVAGVLVETRIGTSSFAVVGVGVNVLQQGMDFPPELREKVTSLQMAAPDQKINLQHLAETLFQTLHDRYQQLLREPKVLEDSWVSRL